MLAEDLELDPLEGLKVEGLAVVQVIGARVQATVDDKPVAENGSTVVPPATFDTVEVFGHNFVPLVRLQVVEVDLTVYGPVGAID